MSDRTEAPTPRRLEEARAEGRIARSLELNTAVILLAGTLLLGGPGKNLVSALQDLITSDITSLAGIDLTMEWLSDRFISILLVVAPPFGIIVVGLAAAGVATTVAQTRFLWASKRVGFDFNRVNPINGFKRIFSMRGLIEIGRALLKILLVGWVAYGFLRNNYPQIILLTEYDLLTAIRNFTGLCLSFALRLGGAYLVLAAADYYYQRWDLMRNLKMTKEEIKEEYKRSEGDPFFKSRIRSQQRRMARMRMMANVPKATVVVTNPTHLAIAIEYRDGMNAPRVLAKGAMRVAERIVALAKEHHVPIVQNITLARAIYKTIDIDREISPDLYLAMAEVLAYVYRLRGRFMPEQQA